MSARNRPVNIEVIAYERDTSERLVKRFIKKCKKNKIQDLFMQKSPGAATFEKPSTKKRRIKNSQEHRFKNRQKQKEKEND